MKFRPGTVVLALFIALGISSCGNQGSLESDSKKLDSLLLQDSIKEQVQEFVHIFPSQVKVARLFKNAGLKYHETDLIPVNAAAEISRTQDRALAMGFYGVDMVYSAMNNQTQNAMKNLKVTHDLASQLGLQSVYEDNNYVQKFENNLNNQDSLESIIRELFAETDAFLKDNQKLDLTLLTFAGGWTESVFLASTYAYSTKNKGIVQLIGDQLVSLDPLIQLLKEIKIEKQDKDLINELEFVRKSIRAGIIKEETDTEPMIIEMDDKKLEDLIASLNVLRNRIIKPKK